MYIPLSNIVSTNYTNGGEYLIKSTGLQYTGPYFVDKNNKFYTGRTYTTDSVELIKAFPDSNSINIPNQVNGGVYATLSPKNFPKTTFTSDYISPTERDYDKGFFSRFILKPTISSQINDFIEVNFRKYDLVRQDPDLQILYRYAEVLWKLVGPLYDEYNSNIRISAGIIDTNKRSIQEAEKILPNVSLYFKDLSQFSRS